MAITRLLKIKQRPRQRRRPPWLHNTRDLAEGRSEGYTSLVCDQAMLSGWKINTCWDNICLHLDNFLGKWPRPSPELNWNQKLSFSFHSEGGIHPSPLRSPQRYAQRECPLKSGLYGCQILPRTNKERSLSLIFYVGRLGILGGWGSTNWEWEGLHVCICTKEGTWSMSWSRTCSLWFSSLRWLHVSPGVPTHKEISIAFPLLGSTAGQKRGTQAHSVYIWIKKHCPCCGKQYSNSPKY